MKGMGEAKNAFSVTIQKLNSGNECSMSFAFRGILDGVDSELEDLGEREGSNNTSLRLQNDSKKLRILSF